MVKMRNLMIACVMALCLCTLALADDGGVIGVGGSVELIKPEHSSIRMVRERVDVTLRDGPRVRCEFVFKNEGKATTVKMGFPEYSYGDTAPEANSKVSTLDGFLSWVDGKPVKTHLVPDKNSGGQSYSAWHVKDVYFAAGQTRKIVDSYSGGLGGDVSGGHFFEYTLVTGASWKGPIGEAIIRVDVSSMLDTYTVDRIEPKGYSFENGIVSWKLVNCEPKENISIYFTPIPTLIINGENQSYLLYDRINGTSMVPVRDVARELDAKVIFKHRICTISKGHHKLEMTVGSKIAVVSSKKNIKLPIAPFIAEDHGGQCALMVPIAAVVRALGGKAKLYGITLDIEMSNAMKPKF